MPSIIPLHKVEDRKKLKILTSSMKKHGWIGEPIPCLWDGEKYIALTGVHRIAAANKAGIDIEIYDIDITGHIVTDELECAICGKYCWVEEIMDAIDDAERLEAAKYSGDEELIRLLEIEYAKD